MIDPEVRRAHIDDADQLSWLETEARASLGGQRGGDRWLETHPARAGGWLGAVRDRDVFVAHIGDVIVGYLVLHIAAPYASVDEVYVSPEARELGFGDALLDAAIEEGRRRGCSVLEGESLPGDRNTKNLYERAGIKARLITVSTKI